MDEKMSKKKIDVELLYPIFEKHRGNLFRTNSGKVSPPSDPVWTEISKELCCLYSPKYLYTLILMNRYNFLDKLNPSLPEKNNRSSLPVISECENEDSDSSSNAVTFNVTLSSQEWLDILPIRKTYKDKKAYCILPPGKWTALIASHFFDLTRLPCALSFRRAKVYERGTYLQFQGSCKECHSILTGRLPVKPASNRRVVIRCQYTGNFSDCKNTSKRHLCGSQRKDIGNLLLSNRLCASSYRKRCANEIMGMGESEPSILPSQEILRNAKYEERKRNRVDNDELRALHQMKYMYPYNNYIKDISLDRFFIHYWSTPQIHVYNKYIEVSSYSRIAIDATGKVVRHLIKPDGAKSSAILLYDITVNDPRTKMQYSVSNMLSERHDSDSIMHWLLFWKRDGAKVPNEITCDMSVALVSAIIRSFTNYSSLHLYLEDCFLFVLKKQQPKFRIPCYVRFDVAHVLKTICGWQCFKNTQRRSRQFYKGCLGQLIQVDTIEAVYKIVKAIFVVALNETEGCLDEEETPCEKNKMFLRRVIGDELDCDSMINEENYLQRENVLINEEIQNNYFQEWGRAIATEVNEEIIQGNRDNCQYLPALVPKVIELLKTLPLWSHVMSRYFPMSQKTSSSAPVESNFNDLKNRVFANYALPIRADEFLGTHIESLEGSMKLAASQHISRDSVAGHDISSSAMSSENREDFSLERMPHKTESTSSDLFGNGVRFGTDLFSAKEEFNTQIKESDETFSGDEEFGAKENWGGLVVPKNRKRSSHLVKNSEWLHIDLKQKANVVPIGILRNANCINLKPVKLEGKNIVLSNTCSFDSLIQLWCCSYCDSEAFSNIVSTESSNWIKLTKQIIKLIGLSAYKLRCIIISEIFGERTILPNGILHIATQSTIESMVRKLCSAEEIQYSYIAHVRCTKCIHIRILPMPVVSLSVDGEDINVQHAMDSFVNTRNFSRQCVKENCGGCTTVTTEFNQKYLMLELTVVGNNRLPVIPKVSLSTVQKSILIEGTKYDLGGFISYSGPEETTNPDVIGHFKAYCRRINDKWELYDSLAQHKIDVTENEKIDPHLVFYRI